jgi:DNA polymerase-3 subunit gamma/tau
MTETKDAPYRVLARKYRPQRFSDLIGQDAMVRTLKNAFDADRIAHAFILTGVRGVGKTTTARIVAKGLNCTGTDGRGGPTTEPCDRCDACLAIAEGRHVDVLEMDAASRTGVGDIREIIEGVAYRATSARYKVYIIDEVHMLSTNAFNALLKTLGGTARACEIPVCHHRNPQGCRSPSCRAASVSTCAGWSPR